MRFESSIDALKYAEISTLIGRKQSHDLRQPIKMLYFRIAQLHYSKICLQHRQFISMFLFQFQDFTFRLHENQKFGWNPRLSAKDFMAVLVSQPANNLLHRLSNEDNKNCVQLNGPFTSEKECRVLILLCHDVGSQKEVRNRLEQWLVHARKSITQVKYASCYILNRYSSSFVAVNYGRLYSHKPFIPMATGLFSSKNVMGHQWQIIFLHF